MIGADSPFGDLWAQLVERLGVPVTEETSETKRPRVEVEAVGAPKFGPCPYRLPNKKVIGRLAYTYLLHCYGDSQLDVTQRMHDLLGWIDDLVGPPQGTNEVEGHHGYQVGPGKDGPLGGDGKGASYSCDVQVTLFLPVVSQVRGVAEGRVTSLQITPSAEDALTANNTLEVL